MSAKTRRRSRAVVVLLPILLLVIPAGPARPIALRGLQTATAGSLDQALRAGNLDEARRLFPVSWAATEQLFVSYLERGYLSATDLDARALAARWAEVHFRVVEYDFARAVLSALGTGDDSKRRQIVAAVRDYFAGLERVRTVTSVPSSVSTAGEDPSARRQRESERRLVAKHLLDVADRFEALSVPRGELWTLRSMTNLGSPDPTKRADELAEQLGDELSLVALAMRPSPDTSLAMAERLGLTRRQATIVGQLGVRAAESVDPEELAQAVTYLQRARELWRAIPAIESVNYWLAQTPAPHVSRQTLPALWGVLWKLRRAADAQPLIAEALDISRPFGEQAMVATLSSFARWAVSLDPEATDVLMEIIRTFGPAAELASARQISQGGPSANGLRVDLAERALAMAEAQADAHERAVTLEWYSRNRLVAATTRPYSPSRAAAAVVQSAKNIPPYPAVYDRLLELCMRSGEVDLTVDALTSQGKFEMARGNTETAVAIFTRAIEHAERSSNYRKAAQAANAAAQPFPTTDGAPARVPTGLRVDFAERAVIDATKADDPLELSRALRTRAFLGIGASRQSFEDLTQAVAAAERYTATSGDPYEEIDCLRRLASEYRMRGEYQAAVDTLESAAAKSKGLGPRANESIIHLELTRAYSTYLGEPALALAAAERARQVIEPGTGDVARPGGQPNPAVAKANCDLARMYQSIAQPDPALDAYARGLSGALTTLNWLPVQRGCLTARARYLTELGDYEGALSDWDAVGSLLKATERNYSGGPHLNKASWLGDVARVHALAGSSEKALALVREGIAELDADQSDSWVGKNFIDTAVGLLLEADSTDEALAFCNRYYERILDQPVSQPVVERAFLWTQATIEVKAGRLDEGRRRLLAAIEIDRRHPTAEIGGLGATLLALGRLEITAKNYSKAKEHLVEARAAINPYDQERIWQIERALALAMARMGDDRGAEARYEAALTTLESVRERLRPEEFRLEYGEHRDRIYEEYAGLLAARAIASGRPADAVSAFQAAERKRTQTLAGLLSTGWSRISPEAMPEQMRRSRDLEARLTAKQALLREQHNLERGRRDQTLIQALEHGLAQLKDEHAQLLVSMAQSRFRYAAPTALASDLAGPVQAALGPPQALVEYLVTDERSHAFVVSSAGIKVVPLGVGRTALRQQVERLLDPFRKLRSGQIDLARLKYDSRQAYDLYQAVFEPVRPLLGAAANIVIVPDDVLHVLPFEALVEAAPQAGHPPAALHGEYASQPFLLRRYAITYLPSAADLLSGGPTNDSGGSPRRLFAMANPAAGPTAPPPAPAPSHDDPLKRQLRSAGYGAHLAPLPGAEAEVERIARSFPRDQSTIVVGARATEEAYKAEAGVHDILHFAVHAIASDDQPLYSTLVLAPDPKGADDGFLQAYEVLRTPLQADLVVLGGCETARGSEDTGLGLVGLVAAFRQAGAKSVLATLWSIDEATSEAMDAFYREMAAGKAAPAALRHAKLQMLQQRIRMGRTTVSLAHPFFWAPFILVGFR